MENITRRSIIATAGATAAFAASRAAAENSSVASEIKYTPAPLPFDPAGISGFSEQIMRSHHERNYSGAVKRLGAIQTKLAGLESAASPGFVLNGLKREELMALNSMILHEIYFAGFNDKKSPGKKLGAQIEADFGSIDSWTAEFTAMGKALGGGSGWVLLTWSSRTGRLQNIWAADHTHGAADGVILLALDMYEHAYAMDYGADAGAYINAFMGAVGWETAASRFAKA